MGSLDAPILSLSGSDGLRDILSDLTIHYYIRFPWTRPLSTQILLLIVVELSPDRNYISCGMASVIIPTNV